MPAPDSSLPDTRTLIARAWERAYPDFHALGRPGFSIDDILSASDSRNAADRLATLDNWLLLFDEFCLWYISLTCTLLEEVRRVDEATEATRAYLALSSYISSQHLAIRRLVVHGFDVQAKQLVRSLVEHLDLAVLLSLAPEFIGPFFSSDTPETSNHFWHSRLARGKGRKLIKERIGLADDLESEIKQWQKEEESILSMTIHPSIVACQMSLLQPGCDESTPWLPFLGAKTDSSQRTLCYAMFSSFYFLLYGYAALFETSTEPILQLNEDNELHRHVKYGRNVLIWLLMFVSEHPDWVEIAQTRTVDHWFTEQEQQGDKG